MPCKCIKCREQELTEELQRLSYRITTSKYDWERSLYKQDKKKLIRKIKYPMREYKLELLKYFYDNQYDEDKYPTFRECDFHYEMDYEGVKYPTYTFYN